MRKYVFSALTAAAHGHDRPQNGQAQACAIGSKFRPHRSQVRRPGPESQRPTATTFHASTGTVT
jgi:hypothetical protein